jgi:Zn-dependent protease with chaperone function
MDYNPPSLSPEVDTISLKPDELTTHKEKTFFIFLLVISLCGWAFIILSVLGLIYALLICLAAWMASGLLAAKLKSESVELTQEQLPTLFRVYDEVCTKLGIQERPSFYLLQSNGLLNAFATRHSGRNFVVIYSSLLESLGHDTPEVRFLIGHELGHIKRNHLLKRLLLAPSLIVPLVGKAYHRACEATCDRFGVFAAGSLDGGTRGLLVLGSGREAAHQLHAKLFANQYHHHRGFFVSWHELASNYPTLSQRVSNVLSLKYPEFARRAKRNPLAYLCAPIFTFQTLIIIYFLAIFASLALPTVTAALKKGQAAQRNAIEHQRLFQQQNSPNPTP